MTSRPFEMPSWQGSVPSLQIPQNSLTPPPTCKQHERYTSYKEISVLLPVLARLPEAGGDESERTPNPCLNVSLQGGDLKVGVIKLRLLETLLKDLLGYLGSGEIHVSAYLEMRRIPRAADSTLFLMPPGSFGAFSGTARHAFLAICQPTC